MAGRRSFLVAGSAGMWMLACCPRSFSQQPSKVWCIGVLYGESRQSRTGSRFDAYFFKRLAELGYVEGRNLAIEWRLADGDYERLDGLAAELVRLKVDAIVVNGTRSARAARQATATIPIVAISFGDPVGSGLVASLSRPGGNLTDLSNMTGDIEVKRLELLMSAVPAATRIAQLVNPDNATGVARIASLRAVAQKAGKDFLAAEMQSARELEEVFARMVKQRVGALMIPNEASISEHALRIAQLAARYKLPSIFGGAAGVEQGGLIGYGPDIVEPFYRAAVLVDRILKGAKPGDIPIEQPVKFELIVNMKTAKAVGIKIPQAILVRADRVIE